MLLNDTSLSPHVGSLALAAALERLIKLADMDVIHGVYVTECRELWKGSEAESLPGHMVFILQARLLQPTSMLNTGFSMFSDRHAPYYWNDQVPSGVVKHDFPREAFVFANLMNALSHRVDVIPEVADIFLTTQIPMSSHTRVIDPSQITAEGLE